MKTTHNVPLKALCLTLGVHFTKRRSLKDSANREKYKEKHSFSFISEVQPIEEALPQR